MSVGWLASQVQCNICTNVWTAVYDALTPERDLECESCGAQDSTVLGRIGSDGILRALSGESVAGEGQ